jgi:hypothetical protein
MEQHQIIVLEEPPSPYFLDMLEERVSVDDYMMELDTGFPQFQRLMCDMLRELHRSGRRIVQVEPYLEILLQIHELLAGGDTPEDVMKNPALEGVYQAEKRATGALIRYYSHCLKAPFHEVLETVKAFARADADRLKLREQMRSLAIKSLVSDHVDVYVEAGYIHYPLYLHLRKELEPQQKVRVIYLLAPEIRKLQGIRRNLGPGDLLTLYYALHGRVREDVGNLLAARSLIYIKLLKKEELLPGVSKVPHCEDIIKVNRIVDSLSVEDCRVLFDQVRLAKRQKALEAVEDYLGKTLDGS